MSSVLIPLLILMATTTSISLCLVLIDLVLLSFAATLTQTSPSYTPVCPGDELVLTCVVYTGTAFWKVPGQGNQAVQVFGHTTITIEGLILNVTNTNGTTVTSTGIYESVSESLNGSVVGCAGVLSITDPQFDTVAINITG